MITLQHVRVWWSGAFWVIPLVGVVVGWAGEDTVTRLDDLLRSRFTGTLSASAAQTLLAAVGGGMVTFTGFVFSVVLLMVQFGSGTYSPRTVSWFLRARTVQWVLAIFLGTIVFSFRALISVGSGGQEDFVPLFGVLVALALLVASLVGFLALIQVVGRSLRVDSVLSSMGRIARRGAHLAGRPAGSSAPTSAIAPAPDAEVEVVRFVGRPGQVVSISVGDLARLAGRHRTDIELLVRVGDGISEGTRIARLHGCGPDHRAVRRTLLVRRERSLTTDPLDALRLLVDVAIRALSPAVNDPTTAVRALDEIDGVLRAVAPLSLGRAEIQAGAGRLFLPAATWSDIVELALIEIAEAGHDAPQVTRRISALLDDLLEDLPDGRHEPLLRHQRHIAARVPDRSGIGDQSTWLTPDRQGLGGAVQDPDGRPIR
ncbi:MAG: DUF2254 domain-containing protein [Pseudonocardia sp.]|uniref:DUF2254 domain-containing protein n=1 Tax=unclassified Pseudonocardia TaxID=2619320 RepID=UPI0008682F3B|nr:MULTISPECIES: DUF2254 domain-containing protein [unclassified Pseudonocardia]MBN9111584.1 DUF2254 domain-containing protein [Pseudonocardia sp.]ODU02898.1 MAG: hypothetical protein ABS80_27215 [Pseudonocardia sp. SCN 72-51]ODU98201.1 MAG: hypothetical protein ABT15_33610 [Pseudonocardia sp. SCN 73-27]